MSVVTKPLYDMLVGDATLAGILGTYNGAPAVFTISPVPSDARDATPYIETAGDADKVADLDLDGTWFRIDRDVRIFDANRGDSLQLDAAAERVAELIRFTPLTIPGHRLTTASARGPVFSETDEDFQGRLVTATFWIEKEE